MMANTQENGGDASTTLQQLLNPPGGGPSPLMQLFAPQTPVQQAGCPTLDLQQDLKFQYAPVPGQDAIMMVESFVSDKKTTLKELLKSGDLLRVASKIDRLQSRAYRIIAALQLRVPKLVEAMLFQTMNLSESGSEEQLPARQTTNWHQQRTHGTQRGARG
jgi:hypothetical protein